MTDMLCPVCRHDDTKVIDSRPSEEGATIRRRRACPECTYRFTTYERLESAPLFVLKRSGDRVAFDRHKVIAGVQAACKGRSVADEDIETLVDAVEEEATAAAAAGKDVTTSLIGHAVLDQLRRLDEVAYMRFASVYKNFDGAADFRRELALLKQT